MWGSARARAARLWGRATLTWDGAIVLGVGLAGACVLVEAATRTSLRDAQTSSECRYPPISALLSAEHVRELEQGRVVVLTGVLSRGDLLAAQADVASLAGLMSHDNHGNDSDVRQDEICWVRESDASLQRTDGLAHCIKLLRGIPFLLARHGYTGAHAFAVPRQCQLSCYAPNVGGSGGGGGVDGASPPQHPAPPGYVPP
jgi:hypothetical protein